MSNNDRAMLRWLRRNTATKWVRRLASHAPVLGVLCEAAIHEPSGSTRLVLLGLACLLSALSESEHRDCPGVLQRRGAVSEDVRASARTASGSEGPQVISPE